MYSCLNETTFCKIKEKEVIALCTAEKLGYVSDMELNVRTGCVTALIVFKTSFFSFSPKCKYRIERGWIEGIGEDYILVNRYELCKNEKKDCGCC